MCSWAGHRIQRNVLVCIDHAHFHLCINLALTVVIEWPAISFGFSQDSRFRLVENSVPGFAKLDPDEGWAVISPEVQLPLPYPIRLDWNHVTGVGKNDTLVCKSATRSHLSPWLHYSLRTWQHNSSKTNISHMPEI